MPSIRVLSPEEVEAAAKKRSSDRSAIAAQYAALIDGLTIGQSGEFIYDPEPNLLTQRQRLERAALARGMDIQWGRRKERDGAMVAKFTLIGLEQAQQE